MSRLRSAMGAGVLVVSMSPADAAGLEPGKSRPERSKSNEAGLSSFGASAGAGADSDDEWISKSMPDEEDGSEPVDSGERERVGSTSRSKSGAGCEAVADSSMPKSTSGFAAGAALGVYEPAGEAPAASSGLVGSICAPMAAAFVHSGLDSPTAERSSFATVSNAVALLRAW